MKNSTKALVFLIHKRMQINSIKYLYFLLLTFFYITECFTTSAQSPGAVPTTNMTFWVKANTTTAGKLTQAAGRVSNWTNEKSTFAVTQGSAANQPDFVPASTNPTYFNFNPRLGFIKSRSCIMTNGSTTPDLASNRGVLAIVTSQKDALTALCYKNAFGDAYQFKPGFRIQSGTGSRGWTIDGLNSPNCRPEAPVLLICNNNGGSMSVRRNGVAFNTYSNANNTTYYPSIGNGLGIGANSGGGENTNEEIAEVILFNNQITAAQMNSLESYLCVKYGITKGTNGSTIADYVNTTGATIWASNTGYHNDIAALGKEMSAEQLDQPKSKSVNFNEIVTISNQDFNTPVSLGSDGQYVVWGNNGQAATAVNAVAYTHASTPFTQQIKRVWRMQLTNSPTGNFVMEVDMNAAGAGGFSNDKVALITDDDATFGNGSPGEKQYIPEAGYSPIGGMLYFTVPYADLTAISYFTIVQSSVIVSNKLISFTGNKTNQGVELNWLTASESNLSHFEIERSADGLNYSKLASIQGSGELISPKRYSYLDLNPNNITGLKIAYYRLKQISLNGSFEYTSSIPVNLGLSKSTKLNVYWDNDSRQQLNIQLFEDLEGEYHFTLFDTKGVAVIKDSKIISPKGTQEHALNLSALESGIYILTIDGPTGQRVVFKVVR